MTTENTIPNPEQWEADRFKIMRQINQAESIFRFISHSEWDVTNPNCAEDIQELCAIGQTLVATLGDNFEYFTMPRMAIHHSA